MDLQELKISLLDMEKRLDDIKDNVLRIESKKIRLDEIDKKLSKEEVWSDLELSQKLSKEKTIIEKTLISFEEVSNKLSDSIVLLSFLLKKMMIVLLKIFSKKLMRSWHLLKNLNLVECSAIKWIHLQHM
jgi:protein subunit release factor A